MMMNAYRLWKNLGFLKHFHSLLLLFPTIGPHGSDSDNPSGGFILGLGGPIEAHKLPLLVGHDSRQ
jgi:hypothetical protein